MLTIWNCKILLWNLRLLWFIHASVRTLSQAGNGHILTAILSITVKLIRLRGNVNWMHARQAMCETDLFGEDFKKDSACCRYMMAAIRRFLIIRWNF